MTKNEWNTNEIGSQLLLFRRRSNLSQDEVASLLGISRNYVSMIERCEADNISLRVYLAICELIGFPAHPEDNLHILFVEMYTAYVEIAGVYGCDYCLGVAEEWRRRYTRITGHAPKP